MEELDQDEVERRRLDDERLLDLVKFDLELRVCGLIRNARRQVEAPNEIIAQHLARVTDPTVAEFISEAHDPLKVLGHLENVQALIAGGYFSDAWTRLKQLELDGNQAWLLASAKPVKAGHKQLRASAIGRDMLKGTLADKTPDILRLMAEIVEQTGNVSHAARVAEKRGLGAFEGNRKLWQRHRRKL